MNLYIPPQVKHVGLRFKAKDAERLEKAANEAIIFGNFDRYSIFRDAAEAARSGHPMRVTCSSLDEAKELAAAIVREAGVVSSAESSRRPG